jgi:hypothetical protein
MFKGAQDQVTLTVTGAAGVTDCMRQTVRIEQPAFDIVHGLYAIPSSAARLLVSRWVTSPLKN